MFLKKGGKQTNPDTELNFKKKEAKRDKRTIKAFQHDDGGGRP